MSARVRPRRLWGGRFTAPPAPELQAFNDSFGFDRELLAEDVAGSIAWADALVRARALTAREGRRLKAALQDVARAGVPARPRAGGGAEGRRADVHEDVHSYVEAALAARLGALAGKLHSGRSRNDQVATDFRLYLKAFAAEARADVLGLAATLAARAEAEAGTAMPGYTHGRRALPVTFGHWCLAYVEMLLRDADRLADAARRGDECPLGSGALAGTPLRVDRPALAAALGFARPSANSMDAVSDRDMALDLLYAGSLLLVHLSRMAEDLVLFTGDELAFAALPDALSTGSSRLPHKKNPDVLELLRGHAARAIGELAGLLGVLKGLPLAYNKDLQLDKEPLFRLRATLRAGLAALTPLVAGLRLDRARMREAASADALLATELADALAARGVPFREAHERVGRRIAAAERAATTLRGLGPSTGVTAGDLAALDVERALARRAEPGGTAPRRVRGAARQARRRIARLLRQAAPRRRGQGRR